ncbi:hypothetical protein F6J84_07160 [Microbacterium caowuchunii]|nr:hypothetical protein F6J84_07160 [Microbacterium caowuchunii]
MPWARVTATNAWRARAGIHPGPRTSRRDRPSTDCARRRASRRRARSGRSALRPPFHPGTAR